MASSKAAYKAQIKATDAQVKAFTLSLDKFLRNNLGRILRKIEDETTTGKEAVQVLGRLLKTLQSAGLDDELAKINDIHADALRFVKEAFQTQKRQKIFSDADLKTVETLVTFDVSRVNERVTAYVGDVKARMMRSIVGGEKASYSDLHNTAGDRLASNVETELGTALAAFSRTVTFAKAQDLGFELFEYLGPEDSITRPFCEDLLEQDPPIYSIDDIEAMDNEQGLPVMQYGGGYNCRHQWRPVSEEDARAEGWEPE